MWESGDWGVDEGWNLDAPPHLSATILRPYAVLLSYIFCLSHIFCLSPSFFLSLSRSFLFFLAYFLSTFHQGSIKLSIPPPRGGGNKIKGFGDGEENQRVEKKEKN